MTAEQTVLVGNDGGFGLPEARTYERDDGTEGEIPPDEIFMPPIRSRANGWKKYHATRDCGRETVRYVESHSPMRGSERYDWRLYCFDCKHEVRWDELLYVSEEWYEDRREAKGYDADWRWFEKLRLMPEDVLALGPDPSEAELIGAIGDAWELAAEQRERLREGWAEIQGQGGDSE